MLRSCLNPFNFNEMDGAMTLKKKIDSEMVAAAKAKDKIKLSAIRMIKTALHNKEIDWKQKQFLCQEDSSY